VRGVTNALTKAREGMRHKNGCFRWTGDGRCVDCHRYTGIPSAVVEFTVGGVVQYYDRQVVERHGLRPTDVSVGGLRPQAPALARPPAPGRVVKPTAEQDIVHRDGARFGGVEPITEHDLVRRGRPADVPQPPSPPGDGGVVVQPVAVPAQTVAPPPPEHAPAEQPQPSPDVVHAALAPERVQTPAADPQPDSGLDGPAQFLVKLRRAQEQLALAAQQPKLRVKRKK
jgi:hypothetical protein